MEIAMLHVQNDRAPFRQISVAYQLIRMHPLFPDGPNPVVREACCTLLWLPTNCRQSCALPLLLEWATPPNKRERVAVVLPAVRTCAPVLHNEPLLTCFVVHAEEQKAN